MGFRAVADAYDLKGVSPVEKLLLMALAQHADEEGRCFPSHRLLAEKTGMSKRTILRAFQSLEDAGHLSRTARARPNGSRSSDLIVLHLGGDRESPGVVTESQGGGDRESPPTTFEPIKEQIKQTKARDLFEGEADSAFESFWSAYPKKKAKPRAMKAFLPAIRKTDLQTMLAALERAKVSDQWTRNDGKFVPHPSTWLNDEGWNDAESVEPPKPERGMPGDRWAFC